VSLQQTVARLVERLQPGSVARDVPLERFTTYRVGGAAAAMVGVSDEAQLGVLAEVLAGDDVDVLVIGRGSNLVVSDHGWQGIVVHLGKGFNEITEDGDRVRAGSAASLPVVANWCARRGLSGFEFTIAIPGSIGGAVRMNAGAHGREMADALAGARIVDLGTGTAIDRSPDSLGLGYRRSNLTDKEVVVHADLGLAPRPQSEIRGLMDTYRTHRAETQPAAAQNAGSVFQNPPGDHAGRLVEAAGLKGFRVGGASVSTLHANFFIADKGAPAQDVYDLVQEVRKRVRDRSGIDLTPEIRFVGHFEERLEGVPR